MVAYSRSSDPLVTDLCSSIMFSVQTWCCRQVMHFLIGFTYGPCWKGIQYIDSVVVGCRCTLSHFDPKRKFTRKNINLEKNILKFTVELCKTCKNVFSNYLPFFFFFFFLIQTLLSALKINMYLIYSFTQLAFYS